MNKCKVLLLGLLAGLISCEVEKKETFNEYAMNLERGYQIVISSEMTKKEYRGAITKIDYGSSVNTTYEINIKQKNNTIINSYLGGEEPKHLLLCPDDIWLHVVGEYYTKTVGEVVKEGQAEDTVDEYKMEIEPRYKKLIDERYFFNLLGDIFWITEEAKSYNDQLSTNDACMEYPLPGANFYKNIR